MKIMFLHLILGYYMPILTNFLRNPPSNNMGNM